MAAIASAPEATGARLNNTALSYLVYVGRYYNVRLFERAVMPQRVAVSWPLLRVEMIAEPLEPPRNDSTKPESETINCR